MNNLKIKNVSNIYIHIPFCKKKCSFCDFSIYAIGSGVGSQSQSNLHFENSISTDYTENLIEEIKFIGSNYQEFFDKNNCLKSIYFGGGTPTLLSSNLLDKIFKTLHNYFKIDPVRTEISIESDPNTFDNEKLKFYKNNLGVNRITMGVQSLDPHVFKNLNRSHSIEDTLKSIEIIRESELGNNFGIDLIQGLPNQNLSSVKNDFNILEKFSNNSGIPHLSIYMLSLEKNSSLFNKYEKEYTSNQKQEEIADMFTFTHNYMTEVLDYDHYEISNFCKKGKHSIHNKSYWDGFSNFYGFGSSSSSAFGGKRFKKPFSIVKYYKFVKSLSMGNYFEEYLRENNENLIGTNDNEIVLELKYLLLNQIRRKEGINLTEIKNIFGEVFYFKIKNYFMEKRNLFNFIEYVSRQNEEDDEYVSLNFPNGMLISDEILVELFCLIEINY